MKIFNKLILGIAAFSVVACNEEPLEQIGPNICPTADFNFTASDLKIDFLDGNSAQDLSTLSNVVDFAKGGINIHGDFGEVVQWELKITNDSEQRTFSGESDTLDVYWYGQGDKFDGQNLQFAAGDARVELEVVCKDMISKDFTVTGVQDFSILDPMYGVLLRDWDKNGAYAVAADTFNMNDDGWAGNGSGANPFIFQYYNSNASPAGGYFAEFYAKTAAPSWYLGGTSVPIAGVEALLTETNTENVYVNFFAKADASLPNCGSQVGFKYNAINYLKTADINWTGWKLMTYKLSDFKSNAGEPLNSTELTDIVLQVGAQPEATDELRVNYDFFILTTGAPLFKE